MSLRTAYPSRAPEFARGFGGISVALVFCVVLLCVFTFLVPCCDVRYDYIIQTMFSSSLPSVVCSGADVLFTLFMFDCI